MTERPYQTEALDATVSRYRAGVDKQLVSLPTGAGKARIISRLPERLGLQPGRRMLVNVHLKQLVKQLAESLQESNPDLKVDIERAQYKASPDADVVVASIQSIGDGKPDDNGTWQFGDRLRQLDPAEFDIVVIDEVHVAPKSKRFEAMLRYMGCYKPDPAFDHKNKLLWTCTATPNRSDNLGMEKLVDEMVFSRSMLDLMQDGMTIDGKLHSWLAHPKGFRVSTSVDISHVEIDYKRGDFQRGQLEKAVNTPARNKIVIDGYSDHGEGMPFIAFTVDVQHSHDLTAAFNGSGIPTIAISGATSDNDRRLAFAMYADGLIRGLVSCEALMTGFDAPSASVALWARPTKSRVVYQQGTGRVLRPCPAPEAVAASMAVGVQPGWIKPYAIVIDYCDNSGQHSLITIPSIFGLRQDFDLNGKKATDAVRDIEAFIKQKKLPLTTDQCGSFKELESMSENIDLFAKPKLTPEIQKLSNLAWTTGPSGGYQVCLPDYVVLRVTQDSLGNWACYRSVKGAQSLVFSENNLKGALNKAEGLIPQDSITMLRQDAKWRHGNASEPQAKLIASLYPEMRRNMTKDQFIARVQQEYSKGEASQLISNRLGSKRSVA